MILEKIGYDYWADNALDGEPATLGYLMSRLKNENLDFIKETETREGEHLLKYFQGNIVLRGRIKDGIAYKLTIQPKGFITSKRDNNFKTLKEIIESREIKLHRIRE